MLLLITFWNKKYFAKTKRDVYKFLTNISKLITTPNLIQLNIYIFKTYYLIIQKEVI